METTVRATPFSSAEDFFTECDLHRVFAEWRANQRQRSAMACAGFRLERCERVPEHRLTILAGSRPRVEETRTPRLIRRAVVRGFRSAGWKVCSDMVAIYWGQNRVQVHVGVMEPEIDAGAEG